MRDRWNKDRTHKKEGKQEADKRLKMSDRWKKYRTCNKDGNGQGTEKCRNETTTANKQKKHRSGENNKKNPGFSMDSWIK